ncbi:MAG: TonB-dependent receptor [Candidatus Aminicenantes bacterium]|nr:TonB-dependent receptor [Candidatus Aminicenantes bacterium]
MTAKRRSTIFLFTLFLWIVCGSLAAFAAAETGTITGIVRDTAGEGLARARVSLLSGERTAVAGTISGPDGRFVFDKIPAGRYVIAVTLLGFNDRRQPVAVKSGLAAQVEVTLEITPVEAEVTVTSTAGAIRDLETLTQPVNVIESSEILERSKAVVAQVALEEPGVQLLRTSPSIAGIYVRGLTGNKVNTYVDGVRYSTSSVRGGITTFMDLVDPASLQFVEILRGPNSAQYGSDALGGSIQFLTRVPAVSGGPPRFWGHIGGQFNAADTSYGANFSAQYSAAKFGLLLSSAARRINLIRPGQGLDSHAAVTRFFGLSSDKLMSDRLPDTDFTQYGGMLKFNWTPSASDQILISYSQVRQEGGKRYDQLLGGDGNLVADLKGLRGDLFYLKYNRANIGPFDQITAVYSYNAQREERINQGGNGNPAATITHEPERTVAHGFQLKATKLWGNRQELLFGFDYYPEHVEAPSTGFNPVTGISSVRRGRVPDGAMYQNLGLYVQDAIVIIPDKLRFVGGVRYGASRYESKASDSPLVNGKPLWPDDSLSVSNVTFRAGLVGTLVKGLSLSANVSRGFRAPHITDLGTVGLTGSGFQVSADAVQGLGAMVGDTAAGTAVSSGKAVEKLRPETSLTWEAGLSYRSADFTTETSVFLNTIRDNIVYQALILPSGAVGKTLGDQTITTQTEGGVVYVPASASPVLVRTNFGDARVFGIEHSLQWRITERFSAATVLTILKAEDIATGLAPNIEGGTPGTDFYLKLRYSHPSGKFWLEPILHAVGKQTRLSSLDLEDRRTGATRTRSNIKNFFYYGATARGWIGPGPDGAFGNADDILLKTGETLAQIQDRVLGVGVSSAPLFTAVPGYLTVNIRAGFKIGKRHDFIIELENLTDENYRGIAWGMDAPGRSLSISYLAGF